MVSRSRSSPRLDEAGELALRLVDVHLLGPMPLSLGLRGHWRCTARATVGNGLALVVDLAF
jgi:hypothetical protein